MTSRLVEQGVRRREQIYDFIVAFHEERGFAPAVAEIAEHCGLSLNAVRGHLSKLQDAGRIDITPRIARSIVPVTSA